MYEKELEVAINAGLKAKEAILDFYHHGFHVEIKSDKSPVTEADKTADEIIRKEISKEFPTHAFLTEESEDNEDRLTNEFVWIVDPVDGTKDFVAKDDQFTTNIALCRNHEVVLGVVLAPAMDTYYYAVKGEGAYKVTKGVKSKIHVSDKTTDITCLTSVFHLSSKEVEIIEKHKDVITHVEKAGSSLKACQISEGIAEISYRLSDGTKEWDTAAFQIIVEEAGGYVLKLDQTPITYNRKDVYNRGGYIILNNLKNWLL